MVVVEPEKLLAALNAARTANGFDPEAQAPPGFSAWCKARGDEGFTVRDIAEGYARRFLNDASIRSKTRSIAVFITKCWKTRVLHIPEPAPPTPLTLELDKRLESLRLNGGAYAASQLREFEAVGLAGDLLQLQPRDSFHAKWASDHYATQLKELRLELLPAPGPPASS